MAESVRGLYGVTPDWPDEPLFAAVEAALQGGMRFLQYRHKQGDAALKRRQAEHLQTLCSRYEASLIINDDPELAHAIGAAGAHIGRGDRDVAEARRTLGAQAILGVSCYADLDRAAAAWAAGADYVAFGAVFPSTIKPQAAAAPLELFAQAKRAGMRSTAIGGITPDNARSVLQAGADAIAVITALFHAPDVRAAAQTFCRLCEHHVP